MSQQHEISVSKEQLRESIQLRDRLHRLLANDDFKALILEGYIREEPVRLTALLGDASVRRNEKVYEATIDEIKAIGLFDNHLRMIEAIGNQAQASLQEYEELEAEMLEEAE